MNCSWFKNRIAPGEVVKKTIIGLLAACVIVFPTDFLAQPKTISREQARTLVTKALKLRGSPVDDPKFELMDRDDPYFPDFYAFSAYYDQKERLAAVGHFSVNKQTADVWDVQLCKKLDDTALLADEKALRKQIGISDREYKKKSPKKPCSSD